MHHVRICREPSWVQMYRAMFSFYSPDQSPIIEAAASAWPRFYVWQCNSKETPRPTSQFRSKPAVTQFRVEQKRWQFSFGTAGPLDVLIFTIGSHHHREGRGCRQRLRLFSCCLRNFGECLRTTLRPVGVGEAHDRCSLPVLQSGFSAWQRKSGHLFLYLRVLSHVRRRAYQSPAHAKPYDPSDSATSVPLATIYACW